MLYEIQPTGPARRLATQQAHTIHLAWYEAQSCQERNRSALSLLPSLTELTSVRNLGFIIDQELNMKDHTTKLCQSCYYQLRQIRFDTHLIRHPNFCPCLHLHASRFLQQNSLWGKCLYLLDRLQSILYSAARLILRIGKYEPISSAIRCDLHWLPVPFRIRYKLNSITSNCLAGRGPEYLIELCHSVTDIPARSKPSVVVPGSAPGLSISEGTIQEKRFLRFLTTAVELTSCRHPTSPQRASTFTEEIKNSLYATVHVTPLRIDVNSVNSTATTTTYLLIFISIVLFVSYVLKHYSFLVYKAYSCLCLA